MQFGVEERLKEHLRLNWLWIAAVGAAVLALWARLALLQFESVDYTEHLKGWFDTLAATPGLQAFQNPVWNYTPPYIYLLKLATIPLAGHALRAVKTLALLFDAGLAVAVFLLVRQHYPYKASVPIAAAGVALFSPTVILNGALWAQSDATYTSLLLLCIAALIARRHALAFLLFGLAVSFKLQAMFVLPLLFVVYLRRPFSAAYFLLIPVTYLAVVAPALLSGMPVSAAFSVYSEQFDQYRKLTYDAPTIYQWIPNQYYDMFVSFGIAVALAVGLAIASIGVLSRRALTADAIVRIGLALTLAVPYVTPKMQDRYFFPADVLSIVYAFYVPRRFFVPVLVTLCSLMSYFPFLFQQEEPVPLPLVAIAMLVPIALVLQDLVSTMVSGPMDKRVDLTAATAPEPELTVPSERRPVHSTV